MAVVSNGSRPSLSASDHAQWLFRSARNPHDQEGQMTDKLVTGLVLLIVGAVILNAATPMMVQLINALTPLVLVVGTLVIVWRLVKYFTRQ